MQLPLGATAIPQASPSARKLYSHRQVLVAAAIGSTLAGGVLLAINFKRLGQRRRAWVTLGLGALAVAALEALGDVADKINPGRVTSGLPLLSALACYWAAKGIQGEPYKSNLANGGGRESWWKTIGWALAGLLVLAIVVFALSL